MLETALTVDQSGHPILENQITASGEWSVVNDFCHSTYTPMKTRPLNRGDDPRATLRKLRVGQITFSRFCFGVPTRADEFDPRAGNILVVNTLRGTVTHPLGAQNVVDTRPGQSYVVDCSRTEYWSVADGYDLQFNLTIPHRLMEETVERWFGFVPDDKLWAHRCVFAENGSSWLALLDYATRSIDARVNAVPNPLTEKRIQETICLDLLQFWCASADIDLTTGARAAAPRYVRDAEKLMDEAAGSGTSVLAVADALGITARSLSEGFRRFRGITPYSYLKTRRLEALHDRLMVASVFDTVTSIAKEMGFVNLGALSASYRERFGETPAQTLHHNNRRRM